MENNKDFLSAQIVIPTLNPGKMILKLFHSIQMQKNVKIKVLVIDSESIDQTIEIAQDYGYQIKKVKRKDFNHGGTRQLGVELCPDAEIIVFLTQDVILADEYAIQNLLECFEDQEVGCAYGRQLPHKDANILAAHARLFNYPAENKIKSIEDIQELGIKAAFISDSFAAYRKKTLEEIGGFPGYVNLCEDIYVAAKMLLNKWKNYYCAEAMAYHSHNYTNWQEFKRYVAIGNFHAKNSWIEEKFGKIEGEGKRFLISECQYFFKNGKKTLIVIVFIRNIVKSFGYYYGYVKGLL